VGIRLFLWWKWCIWKSQETNLVHMNRLNGNGNIPEAFCIM
jgi:hypothetical protein